MRFLPLLLLMSIFVTGCCLNKPAANRPVVTYDLAVVVEAVQYAIDAAADDEAWSASKNEKEHWTKACEEVAVDVAQTCGDMRKSAEPLCEMACKGNFCSPIDNAYCALLESGKAHAEICTTQVGAQDPIVTTWCGDAAECSRLRTEEKRICDAVKSIALPKLEKAVLSLKVEESTKRGGGVSIFVVEFGGSRTNTSASTVSLELKPRVRDDLKYGTVGTLDQTSRTISEDAVKLSSNLITLIKSAVRAGTLEIVDGTGKVVRPPLALSGFKIELALGVTDDGKLTIGKKWDSVPASVEFGSENKQGVTNSLALTYKR